MFGLGHHSPPILERTWFKISCRADKEYSLSVRDDTAVLALENPDDERQHWYKDTRFIGSVKDEEGQPAFTLVNKATGLAIEHSLGQSHPVELVPYTQEFMNETLMWTESEDVGKGYRCIRMASNIGLNFDAFHGDKDHGGVRDGTTLVLWEWCQGKNQSWKIQPLGMEANAPPPECGIQGPPVQESAAHLLSAERTVRILCRANEEYSLTARDGTACLAPANPADDFQHWVKDMRRSTSTRDEEGHPAFALVNKVTGEAIKHSLGHSHPQVKLVPYDPEYLDESVLWTESKDVGDGFRCIRMVNNIYLNFDAFHGDKDHGGVHDGTTIVLWEWCEGDNQRWKILPW